MVVGVGREAMAFLGEFFGDEDEEEWDPVGHMRAMMPLMVRVGATHACTSSHTHTRMHARMQACACTQMMTP
jgi:hypothetical protein